MKAVWKGALLAQSEETTVMEGNHYFPKESIQQQYLKESNHHTTCSWKGEASYYDIVVEGQTNPAAAWYYPNPKQAASQIKDRIAFWKGVEVVP